LLENLTGEDFGGTRVVKADDFTYIDPVDHSITPNAGIRIVLEDGSRVVFRMSGTGTEGATLRVYLERFSTKWDEDVPAMVEPLARAVRQFLRLRERFGRDEPDVVT
jgi:phosphoglucomutase